MKLTAKLDYPQSWPTSARFISKLMSVKFKCVVFKLTETTHKHTTAPHTACRLLLSTRSPLRSPPTLAGQTASRTPSGRPEGWAGWGQQCPARPNPGRYCRRSDRTGSPPGSVCTGSRRRRLPAANPESPSPTGTERPGTRGRRDRVFMVKSILKNRWMCKYGQSR